MHCCGVILAHSSTQTVFKSWRFSGPLDLQWILIFSSFHRFVLGFKSGDWLGHSNNFIFFLWNQWRVSLAVCLGSLSWWNVHLRFIFILVDGSIFLVNLPIHPSFNYVKFASTICWKAAPYHVQVLFYLYSTFTNSHTAGQSASECVLTYTYT